MKKCPFCAEEIQEEAKVCRYCHSRLDEENIIADGGDYGTVQTNQMTAGENTSSPVKTFKIIFLLCALVYIVSCFFPLVTVEIMGVSASQSIFEYGWYYAFGAFLITTVPFSFFLKGKYIAAGLVCLLDIIIPIALWGMMINPDYPAEIYQKGAGFYIMIAGAIGEAIACFCANAYKDKN
ncbi:MAG: hypothetical protein ACI4J7_02050 [Ruminiclostridium sp.]